jgi:hypothetical protein
VRSAKSEYVVFVRDSSPEIHVIAEVGKRPNVRNGAPESLRHVSQWQLVNSSGREEEEYVT